MTPLQLLGLLAAVPLASAHFGLEYPEWRANTLDGDNPAHNQWTWPCGGVLSNETGVNRTDWPLDGGSIALDLHHSWTYLFISLGLQLTEGSTVTTFNYSLTGGNVWNQTGNGTLFIEKLTLPASLKPKDGQKASIQVVTPGGNGNGLYNCADITFRSNATVLPAGRFQTSPGVTYYPVASGPQAATNSSTGTTTTNPSTTSATPKPTGAAGTNAVSGSLLTSVVGLALLFAYGVSF